MNRCTDPGEIDPQRIGDEIERAGVEWARLLHAAALLTKTQRSVFAELVQQLLAAHPGIRRRDAEETALCSEPWKDHIYAVADAQHAANLARVHFDAARARFEALRTAEATRRAEMQTLGRR